jgi:hypothetical protein
MQTFATAEDIAFLITEGRKFGVAFCGAHVDRYGQLADNRKIAGATLATVNKVFFQLSVADAQEVAAEFADSPPVEYRRERQYTISRQPYWDLINHGHTNKHIEQCITYFKAKHVFAMSLKDRIDQLQLERTGFLDQATIARDASSLQSLAERRVTTFTRGRDVPVDRNCSPGVAASVPV